jgi:hypothetical protein
MREAPYYLSQKLGASESAVDRAQSAADENFFGGDSSAKISIGPFCALARTSRTRSVTPSIVSSLDRQKVA